MIGIKLRHIIGIYLKIIPSRIIFIFQKEQLLFQDIKKCHFYLRKVFIILFLM